MIDSLLYYFAMQTDNETLQNVSDVTFACYGFVLTISCVFLMIAICRISRLLKKFDTVKLNAMNIGYHTVSMAL